MNRTSLVAAALAGLFGCASTPAAAPSGETTALVHCSGVNECKGQGACAGAENACKAQNECKGHGFVELTADQCKEQGGTVVASN